MYLCYFLMISPWNRAGALHLNRLEFPLPKDDLCQVWLKLAQQFLRRRFLIMFYFALFTIHYSLFCNYLPLGRGMAQVWLKLAQQFLRRWFLIMFYFALFTILQLSPVGKGNGPSLEQTWIPFTQGCFVPSYVKLGPVVLEKKSKIRKVYKQTDGQTDRQTADNRRSEKLTWAFSSG